MYYVSDIQHRTYDEVKALGYYSHRVEEPQGLEKHLFGPWTWPQYPFRIWYGLYRSPPAFQGKIQPPSVDRYNEIAAKSWISEVTPWLNETLSEDSWRICERHHAVYLKTKVDLALVRLTYS